MSLNLTIIIPCYNEQDHIANCLNSLLDNEFDRDRWEILVVDGMSDDRTREIVAQYSADYSFIRLVDNPERIKPVALNRGIRESLGAYVMRIDAHSVYATGYVDQLFDAACRGDAHNVGGVQVAVDESREFWGLAIANAMSHPLAMGDAVHRMRFLSKPRYVDTVFCGCYSREVFKSIGFFNEKLIRTQDREFNERLRLSGRKTLLIPSVHAYYKPRTNISGHVRWVYDGARWLFLAGRYTDVSMIKTRNLIPLAFVVYLFATIVAALIDWPDMNAAVILLTVPLILYVAILAAAGVILAFQQLALSLILSFPLTVVATHLAYGVGSIIGLLSRQFPEAHELR